MSNQTSQFTAPDPVIDQPADKFSSPHEELRIENGRQLKSNPGFEKALDKATKKEPKEGDAKATGEEKKPAPKKTGLFDKADAAAKAENQEKNEKQAKNVDPIAKANAEDAAKKESKKAEKGSRVDALLAKDEDEEEAPAPDEKKDEVKADKSEKGDEDLGDVTEEEIEHELKTPKTEKSDRRYRFLYNEAKKHKALAAEHQKQVAERDSKIAEYEKKVSESEAKLSKSTQADPDIQKKLDELDMYKRRDELESSDHVKTTFDARIQRQEENIYTVLAGAGIKFKGMDEKQSAELIKKTGGFREFSRKHPDLVDGILDALPVADRKDVEAAMMGQTMLEQEKKNFIETEKGKAKEYFENQRKEAAAAKATEIPPEKRKEAQKQAIEKLKTEMFQKYDFFNEAEIPADASAEEKKRLSETNSFSKELRETLASHLNPANDEDFIDTALQATAAHKFKRENVAMRKELKQLRAEIEKVRNGSKTSTKGGAIPISNDNRPTKPAPSFGAAIDRAQERRGSGF